MYTREEASRLRKQFWTAFGQYMRPVMGANGEAVNWLNYKTGVRYIFFRMEADNSHVRVMIEIDHPDAAKRAAYLDRFQSTIQLLNRIETTDWSVIREQLDEHGKPYNAIVSDLKGVNVFQQSDWPAIISFLKPRMIALDAYWNQVRYFFE